MAKRKKKSRGRGPSPSLVKRLSAGAMRHLEEPVRLTKAQLLDLKKILRGTLAAPVEIDRKRAVRLLARSESSAASAGVLAKLAADAGEPTGVRVTAVSSLATMPRRYAEAHLLDQLTDPEPRVRAAAVEALARVGGVASLERLRKLPQPIEPHARRQLAFAKVAIAYRADAAEARGESKALVDRTWLSQRARPLERRDLRRTIDRISGSTFGVELNPEVGFGFRCGDGKHVLFLNRELGRGSFVSASLARKRIAGLVAAEETETGRYTVRYVLFSKPRRKGVELTVARTNGQVVFAGTAALEDGALRLTGREAGAERTPTELAATVTDDAIDWSVRVWPGGARGARLATPLVG